MQHDFYRAFEDRQRGSRELIMSRLQVYLPLVHLTKDLSKLPRALDLGCGRCEWLEILTENGFDCLGVDLDEGMLGACRERGLRVKRMDAIACLKGEAEQNVDIVSAFHVAEHLPFEMLQTLLKEALRVLKPGGLLILETPNPESLIVSSKGFYADPTHLKPLPPELLSFLAEYAGFLRSTTMRLQENKNLLSSDRLSLMDVLYGSSPDYSVVAQKQGSEEVVRSFDHEFSRRHGITLDYLLSAYDRQIEERFQQLEAKALRAEEEARQAEQRLEQVEARIPSRSQRNPLKALIIFLGRKVLSVWVIAKPAKLMLHLFPRLEKRLKRAIGNERERGKQRLPDRVGPNGSDQLPRHGEQIYQDLVQVLEKKIENAGKKGNEKGEDTD